MDDGRNRRLNVCDSRSSFIVEYLKQLVGWSWRQNVFELFYFRKSSLHIRNSTSSLFVKYLQEVIIRGSWQITLGFLFVRDERHSRSNVRDFSPLIQVKSSH